MKFRLLKAKNKTNTLITDLCETRTCNHSTPNHIEINMFQESLRHIRNLLEGTKIQFQHSNTMCRDIQEQEIKLDITIQLILTCRTFSKNLFKACKDDWFKHKLVRSKNNHVLTDYHHIYPSKHIPTHNQQLQDHACEELKFLFVNE